MQSWQSADVIDLAAAARALREAAGAEFAHLIPDHDAPEVPPAALAVPDAGAAARVSRAHQAIHLPGGLLATTDMGLDLVRIWREGPELRLLQEVPLPKGSGPRHGLWHPSGHLYIVTELTGELFVLVPDVTGSWRLVSGVSLSPAFEGGRDLAADLAVSRDQETLYAGIRGSDTIAAVRVRGSGAELAPLALAETGTVWPRQHVVVHDTLLIAGQRADEVVSLGLDLRTGVPGRVRHRTTAPSPTCLLPVRA